MGEGHIYHGRTGRGHDLAGHWGGRRAAWQHQSKMGRESHESSCLEDLGEAMAAVGEREENRGRTKVGHKQMNKHVGLDCVSSGIYE